MSFKDLGLTELTLKAIADCGYEKPTPIQTEAIPLILMARDVVGLAQTGTGKTASFTLPMIEILSGGRAKARMPRSLVLTPTRELAAQVAENFDTYGRYTQLSKALLVGGVSMADQIKVLERGADVLIATPGRLLDLFGRGNILLNDIKILVIDEADRMLDMGFIPDIEKIVGLLSPMRQTLLFSATMPQEIRKLTNKFLSNPKEISVSPASSAAEKVTQKIIHTAPRSKKTRLAELLGDDSVENAFIFCNRKKDVDLLAKWLKQEGFSAQAMHGDMPQAERTRTLNGFKKGDIKLLVCSDVAARGIDVHDTSHVFNFDVPMNAEDYIHRIGRTGRAGKEGQAFMLATKSEEKYVQAIEKLLGKALAGESEKDGQRENKQKAEYAEGRGKTRGKARHSSRDSSGAAAERQQKQKQEQKGKSRPHKDHSNENSYETAEKGFGEDVPAFFTNK